MNASTSPAHTSIAAMPAARRTTSLDTSRRRSARERRSPDPDRKSTRLNSSHSQISYAVFCLKKKKQCDSKRGADPADQHPGAESDLGVGVPPDALRDSVSVEPPHPAPGPVTSGVDRLASARN